MAHIPAALADRAADVTYVVFCCVFFSFFLYFEIEKRGVTAIVILQKYLLSFKYAQASVYFHCCGESHP